MTVNSEIQEKEIQRKSEIHDLKKKGRRVVGYHCVYTPLELIYASGAIPVRLAQCGNQESKTAAQKYVRDYYCDFSASCLGNRITEKDGIFQDVEFMMMAHTCDKMKKVMELWNRYLQVPSFIISLPRKNTLSRSMALVEADMNQAKMELEKWTGNRITEDNLNYAISLYNQMRELLHHIYALRKTGRIDMSVRECLEIVRIAHLLDVGDAIPWLSRIITERQADNGREKTKIGPRLMLTGAALACGNQKLLSVLDQAGVDVAIEDTCTGSRWFWDLVEKDVDPLKALSHHLLHKVPSCGRMIPMDPWFDHLKSLAADYKIEGVIYHVLRYCDDFAYLKPRLENEFAQMGIPFLYLKTDYLSSDQAQLLNKVQAFCEMISGELD